LSYQLAKLGEIRREEFHGAVGQIDVDNTARADRDSAKILHGGENGLFVQVLLLSAIFLYILGSGNLVCNTFRIQSFGEQDGAKVSRVQ
jgi:hypothetical protein